MFRTALLLCALNVTVSTFSQPLNFYARGIGGGGALFFPAINPADNRDFYVSCDMSQLFHSTDNGFNYTQVPFQKLQVFGNSSYEFTINPNIAYSLHNDGNNGYPVKTTDSGTTWSRLTAYNVNTYGKVYKMHANYRNPEQLIIGAYGDILISNDGGNSFSLVKHAANMGSGIVLSGVFWDLYKIYIATNEGMLISSDSGKSFRAMSTSGIPAGQCIWNFAAGRENLEVRFVCIATSTSNTYNGIMPWNYNNFAKGIYVMDNADGIWKSRSNGIDFNNDFVMYASMAVYKTGHMVLGGHDKAKSAPLVLLTDDGGITWNKSFKTTNNENIATAWEGSGGDKNWSWSETCFGITMAPNDWTNIIFTTYSGVYISDNTDNWRQAYVHKNDQHPKGTSTPKRTPYHSIGLETSTCWQILWQDRAKMFAANSDIGLICSNDSGKTWGYQYTGLSVNSVYRLEQADGKLFAACSNIHDMYQSTRLADAQLDANDANGKIVYSSDQGQSWNLLHQFGHPVFWLASDPEVKERMYASVVHYGGTQGNQAGGIYRCNDLHNLATSSWAKLANPPRTEGHPAWMKVLKDGKLLCSFSGRRNNSGAFTASSGVFLYDPAFNTWEDKSHPGMHYWTKDIVVDPQDSLQNTWYTCVYSGWGGAANGLGGLYRTTDRGITWTKLTGTQFDRVASLTFEPGNPDRAYLSTETQGLWLSENIRSGNPSWTLVKSYHFRQPERIFFNPFDDNEMWVSSFGNGMKIGNLQASTSAKSFHRNAGLKLFPNPGFGQLNIELPNETYLQFDVYTADGQCLESGQIDGNQKVLLETKNWPAGLYLIVVKGKMGALSSKYFKTDFN